MPLIFARSISNMHITHIPSIHRATLHAIQFCVGISSFFLGPIWLLFVYLLFVDTHTRTLKKCEMNFSKNHRTHKQHTVSTTRHPTNQTDLQLPHAQMPYVTNFICIFSDSLFIYLFLWFRICHLKCGVGRGRQRRRWQWRCAGVK